MILEPFGVWFFGFLRLISEHLDLPMIAELPNSALQSVFKMPLTFNR